MSLTTRIKEIHHHLDDLAQMEIDRRIEELLAAPKYQDPRKLSRYEHRVYSQSGEDGVLAQIFNRIGVSNEVFVECAAGNGIENNTVYLLTLGWKGCWIECEPKHVRQIRRDFARRIQGGSLSVKQQFVTVENIESLLGAASLPADFDLLSIDIDRNDYWVWRKIERFRPRVVVIEYNAIFPPGCFWVVDYDPKVVWDKTSHWGASLGALERLGREKGYALVGCTLAGTNAFFVQEGLAVGRFLNPFTAENHYEPPRYYLTSRRAGDRRRPA